MITGAIAVLLAIVVLPVVAGEGNWGMFWFILAIIGVVLLCGSTWRTDAKARVNFRHYWADGGPDRERRR